MKIPRLLPLVLCASAFAQDDPAKKPTPEKPAADAGKSEAKKERKVDPAAMKALERHASLIASPANAGVKSIAAKGDLEQNGATIGLDPKWTDEKGFDVGVRLPAEMKDNLPPGVTDEQVDAQVKQQLGIIGLNSVFETPGRNWAHFNVASKASGDDLVVDLDPFDDQADAASRSYVFGKDGLLKRSTMSPKVDPNNPQAAMLEGVTFDAEWKFEKKGDKFVLASRSFSVMGTEIATTFAYYELPGGLVLPKEAKVATPQGEQTIAFHDYVVDGKPLDATKKTEAKPAEKPAEKPADKPAVPDGK